MELQVCCGSDPFLRNLYKIEVPGRGPFPRITMECEVGPQPDLTQDKENIGLFLENSRESEPRNNSDSAFFRRRILGHWPLPAVPVCPVDLGIAEFEFAVCEFHRPL